ncbi:STAS domain-containing protein [Streptomyces sp. NPDC001549]|uniref:STAS domain-containing protein n=1 Tax=Streptomyces sp. NPDC001549 TaxID=3364586 RepID=UPI003674C916
MPNPNTRRYDEIGRTLITVTGELDLDTVHPLRATLTQCLRDGARTVDIDLTALTFCDCSGLNVFLSTWQQLTAAGGSLHLHHPPRVLARLIGITGSGFLLGSPPAPAVPPVTAALRGVA